MANGSTFDVPEGKLDVFGDFGLQAGRRPDLEPAALQAHYRYRRIPFPVQGKISDFATRLDINQATDFLG